MPVCHGGHRLVLSVLGLLPGRTRGAGGRRQPARGPALPSDAPGQGQTRPQTGPVVAALRPTTNAEAVAARRGRSGRGPAVGTSERTTDSAKDDDAELAGSLAAAPGGECPGRAAPAPGPRPAGGANPGTGNGTGRLMGTTLRTADAFPMLHSRHWPQNGRPVAALCQGIYPSGHLSAANGQSGPV